MSMKLYLGSKPLLPKPIIGSSNIGAIYNGSELVYGRSQWQPTQINGLTNLWRSDYGVTVSASRVTSWEDSIAGKTLTLESGSSAPQYNTTDSGFSNKPSIEFGNYSTNESLSDNANPVSTTLSDVPFLYFVMSYDSGAYGTTDVVLGGDNINNTPGQIYRISTNTFSYQNRFVLTESGVATSGTTVDPQQSISTSYKNWVGIAWKNTPSRDGYWYHNGVEETWYTSGTDGWGFSGLVSSGIKLVVGNSGPGSTQVFKGKVVEMGFGLERPNADALSNLNDYMNRRYGI